MAADDTQQSPPPGQKRHLQLLEEAHESFAKNIATAANNYKDPQVKNIISILEIVDPKRRAAALRNSKCKKDILIETAIFLQSALLPKNPLNIELIRTLKIQELIPHILKLISAASPTFCRNCASVFNGNTKSVLHCFQCGAGACNNCVTKEALNEACTLIKFIAVICEDCLDNEEETELNVQEDGESQSLSQLMGLSSSSSSSSTEEVNNKQSNPEQIDTIETIEVITMIENGADTDNTKTTTNSKVVLVDDVGDESNFVVNKKKTTLTKKTAEVTKKKVEEEKDEDPESVPDICKFYVQFRCKFGRAGKECDYSHPKICLTLMNKGTQGCPKSDQCEYVHPKMCNKSLKGINCESKSCHVLGTRDVKKDAKFFLLKTNLTPRRTKRRNLRRLKFFAQPTPRPKVLKRGRNLLFRSSNQQSSLSHSYLLK